MVAFAKIALCFNRGWQLRRVLTDGVLIKVYDWETDKLRSATLLPIALLGRNMTLVDPADVPAALEKKGGYHCEFEVSGHPLLGWILDGKFYCAAWSEGSRPFHFETTLGPNPNGKVLRRLTGPEPKADRKPWECQSDILDFVSKIQAQAKDLSATDQSHPMILPDWKAEAVEGSWTIVQDSKRFALRLAVEGRHSKPGTYRAIAYVQELKGARCTNTAEASVHTGNRDAAGNFQIQPKLDPPQWRALAQRMARDPLVVKFNGNEIELGSLEEPLFLKRLLAVAREIHQLRTEE